MGLGLAVESPDPLQPRLGGPRAESRGPSASSYVWWDEQQGRWAGHDVPDFTADKRPDYVPPEGAKADEAIRGDHPFIMQADGRGWLFVPSGLVDGPFPTHFEPQESPFRNPLYGQQSNPARKQLRHRLSPFNPTAGEQGADAYPYVLTTFRLTEHHTAGGMTRTVPYLAEIQPEMFCEVSPGARRRARPRERRLGHHHHRAHRDRGARARHRPSRAARRAGTGRCSRSRSPGTGGRAGSAPVSPRTTCSGSRSTRTSRSRRCAAPPATSAPAAARAAAPCANWWSPIRTSRCTRRDGIRPARAREDAPQLARELRRRGAAADGLLHRHERLHRLQGLRGRLQGVERGAPGRAAVLRRVVRQHRLAQRQQLAPRRVHRAADARRRTCRRPTATFAG